MSTIANPNPSTLTTKYHTSTLELLDTLTFFFDYNHADDQNNHIKYYEHCKGNSQDS
jgi:hypothetical protein